MKLNFENLLDDFRFWFGLALFIVVVAICLGMQGEANWRQFAQEHDCKVIARHDGTNSVGVTYTGKVGSIYTPGTVTYRCNDGVDYTR
jgi:hypothetical protein